MKKTRIRAFFARILGYFSSRFVRRLVSSRVPIGVSFPAIPCHFHSPKNLSLDTPHYLLHAQRADIKSTQRQNYNFRGRPAPPYPGYRTSKTSRFFWSQKRVFFCLILALKLPFFCHFFDIARNWPKTDLFVVRIPLHSDIWDRFFGTFCLPRFFCYENSPSF